MENACLINLEELMKNSFAMINQMNLGEFNVKLLDYLDVNPEYGISGDGNVLNLG